MLAPTLIAPWAGVDICEAIGDTSPEVEVENEEIEAATTHAGSSLGARPALVLKSPGRRAASQMPVGTPPTPPPERIG